MICLSRQRLETCLYSFNLARQLDWRDPWSLKFRRSIFRLVRVWPDQSAYFEEKGAGAAARVFLWQKQEASACSWTKAAAEVLWELNNISSLKIKNNGHFGCLRAGDTPPGCLSHQHEASNGSQPVGKKSNWSTLDVWQEANPFFLVVLEQKPPLLRVFFFLVFVTRSFPDGSVK